MATAIEKRLAAIETALLARASRGSYSQEPGAVEARIEARLEAWKAKQAIRASMTAEQLAAADAADEAAFWKSRAGNPVGFDAGCRFTMTAGLQAALGRRRGRDAADHPVASEPDAVPQGDGMPIEAKPLRMSRRGGEVVNDSLPDAEAWNRER